MDERMNAWIDGLMDFRMDRYFGWMDWIYGWIGGSKYGWIVGWMNECVDGSMNLLVDGGRD